MIHLVEFHRGFAAFNSHEEIVDVISQEVGIRLSTRESYEEAYVDACQKYGWKEWERNPWVLPTLPRFEDWQAAGFHFTSGVPLMQPPCWRVFSARSYDVIAILTSTVNVIEFLAQHPDSIVMEESSVQAAQNALNWVLLQHLLAFAPYITGGLPCLQNLPLDTIIPVDFAEKFKECLSSVPQQLPHPRPQWQLTASGGGVAHVE